MTRNSIQQSLLFKLLFAIAFLLFGSSISIFATIDSWQVINSTKSELILKYTPHINNYKTITLDNNQIAYIPVIANSYRADNIAIGSPIKLLSKQLITIPSPDGFELSNVKISKINCIDKKMAPVPLLSINSDFSESIYNINEEYYKPFNNPNENWVSINYSGIARDRFIADLVVSAARYNTLTNKIEIPEEIIITIKFKNHDNILTNFANNQKNDFTISINDNETLCWRIANTNSISKSNTQNKLLSNNNNNWAKITINEDGLYRISSEMLSQIGLNVPKELAKTVKIIGNAGIELSETISDALNNKMNEIPCIINTNSDGSFKEIVFYGAAANGFEYKNKSFVHYINHYSANNYYLLTFGGEESNIAKELATPEGEVINKPTTYINRIFYEEELNNPFSSGGGREWFGRSSLPVTFTNLLHNLVRSDDILYRYSVAHKTRDSSGYFYVYESDIQLSKVYLQGLTYDYDDAVKSVTTYTLPANSIPSDLRSNLKFNYQNSLGLSATPFFDWYEIHYPSELVAYNNEIKIFDLPNQTGITEYSINGYTGNTIYGFNVTNPAQPQLLKNISNTGGLFVFRTDYQENTPQKFYISTIIKNPANIEKIEIANLRTDFANADMIVITHTDLMESALKYKQYRESNSELKVAVINTKDIFQEFNSCVPDPTAIRDFLAFAYHNWETKPKYVLLWGDGHYDYKNISTTKTNYVFPYETIEDTNIFSATASSTSDDFYAKISGNDRMIDLAIGRLTVDSPSAGEWILKKINLYENSSSKDSWTTNITLLADDSPQAEKRFDYAGHTNASEILDSLYLIKDIQRKKIYLPEYPTVYVSGKRRKPGVNQELLTVINTTGTLLLNWFGHGNPRVWAHEEILERDITIPQMLNLDKLFFATAGTCDFGRFDMTEIKSGAEELVFSKLGAAIGILSASRVVFADDNADLINVAYTQLFKRNSNGNYPRLGDMYFATKLLRTRTNDEKFFLLADPSLKLHLADKIAVIDSINGKPVLNNSEIVELKALSQLSISGKIVNQDTTQIDNSFNGTTVVTMLDCDEYISPVDIDGTIHYIKKPGSALNRSAYPVVNGKFNAQFIIPKDISFSGQNGSLFLYAYSNDNQYAKGLNRAFTLGGIESNPIEDNQGPDIKIFFDTTSFVSGNLVRNEPLLLVDLFDESGLNTTGKGIGHKIEAWFDDNPLSVDLTDKFTNSLEDSRAGTIQKFIYSLEPGTHKIKIRAWDVFNNFSTQESYFRIANSNDIIISELFNYPNPVNNNKTNFYFVHNLTPPFDVEIKVYTSSGNLIKTINSTIMTAFSADVLWDGMKFGNETITSGTYYYRLTITKNGNSKSTTGMFVYVK